MSNFGFIRAQWPELYDTCQRAESYALSDPDTAAFHPRVAVEKVVEGNACILPTPVLA